MMIDPWHGTWDDKPEWDRPPFAVVLGTAVGLWLVVAAQIRWVVRHLRA